MTHESFDMVIANRRDSTPRNNQARAIFSKLEFEYDRSGKVLSDVSTPWFL